jgi:hypothetical protein
VGTGGDAKVWGRHVRLEEHRSPATNARYYPEEALIRPHEYREYQSDALGPHDAFDGLALEVSLETLEPQVDPLLAVDPDTCCG